MRCSLRGVGVSEPTCRLPDAILLHVVGCCTLEQAVCMQRGEDGITLNCTDTGQELCLCTHSGNRSVALVLCMASLHAEGAQRSAGSHWAVQHWQCTSLFCLFLLLSLVFIA